MCRRSRNFFSGEHPAPSSPVWQSAILVHSGLRRAAGPGISNRVFVRIPESQRGKDDQSTTFLSNRIPGRCYLPLSVSGSFEVIVELSEGGARVLVSCSCWVWLEDCTEFAIAFQAGDTATSTATLVRIDGDQIVIRFSSPFPLPIIIEQQLLLIIQVSQG